MADICMENDKNLFGKYAMQFIGIQNEDVLDTLTFNSWHSTGCGQLLLWELSGHHAAR